MAVFRGTNPFAAGVLVWDQIAGPGDVAFDDLSIEDRAALIGLALDAQNDPDVHPPAEPITDEQFARLRALLAANTTPEELHR